MFDTPKQLRNAGFSELACQFAAYIARLDKTENPIVSLSAALVSEAVSEGHVCLNIDTDVVPEVLVDLVNDGNEWKQRLLESNVVEQAGGYAPLVLDEAGQLYLYRYWQNEVDVAKQIKLRSQVRVEVDDVKLKADFEQWHSSVIGTDWQKVAVLIGLTQGLAVISGGPGTGKTTIVKTLLQFLHHQQPGCRVALVAPTGKAAARLQQATQDSPFKLDVKTIHRLLGITANNEQGRFSSDRPLPVDVLIVDEASMIDISLMATLLASLTSHTRLILLGDSQQLASVESGAVFANLCQQQLDYDAECIELALQCGIHDLAESHKSSLLRNQFVQLQHSYRFSKDSLIWLLANRINVGDYNSVTLALRNANAWQTADDKAILHSLVTGYANFIDAVETHKTAKRILFAFEQFRLLAALKQGPQSVESVHRLMQRHLAQRGWRTQHDFYHGRPIMISQNDYRQQLFNGDVGVILQDETGQLQACFCFDDKMHWVPLNRLPAHDTAFAMTVHKSQGSEFDDVALLLPNEISPVLNKELLYTVITRAKKNLQIHSDERVLIHTISIQHQRESGLNAKLV
jgi:exodeoxyribonuclease V alpha subunit